MNVNKGKRKEHSMARKTTRATLLGLVGTLMVTALVAAQQPGMSGHMPSMGNMMQECRTHHQEMTTMMSKAQQSNNPAQMRETLEQAQQSLAAMKDHMGPCMNMMSMMEQMQGGMGSQMKKK
jgi:hypothetical protein